MVAYQQEKCPYGEDGAGAGKPDALVESGAEVCAKDAEEHTYYSEQEEDEYHRHGKQVGKVFVGLHVDRFVWVYSVAVGKEGADNECEEEYQKENRVHQQRFARAGNNVFVVYVVDEIERSQDAHQKEYRHTENDIP